MKKKEKAIKVVENLIHEYPNAVCSLDYSHDYELLIAGRLSAQCTDKRVNIVTKVLFEKYKSLDDFAHAEITDLEKTIMPCGLYKTKAQNIRDMCAQLIVNYNYVLPSTIKELTSLSGIGRKTANLIMGEIFHKPAIITDTHCIRISNRLGFTKSKNPAKVEEDLLKIIPKDKSVQFCHCLVWHGREICKARGAKCSICCLNELCLSSGKV